MVERKIDREGWAGKSPELAEQFHRLMDEVQVALDALRAECAKNDFRLKVEQLSTGELKIEIYDY